MQKCVEHLYPTSLVLDSQIKKEKSAMAKLLPDQSFYPSPKMAIQAPSEKFAYVALLNANPGFSRRYGRPGPRPRVEDLQQDY
jgi:hypothetical protein